MVCWESKKTGMKVMAEMPVLLESNTLKAENLSLKTVMLLKPHSASHLSVQFCRGGFKTRPYLRVQFGEILKQVQDDKSRKFQMCLDSRRGGFETRPCKVNEL